MELKKIQPGYPCHKYLARNIKNEQDLWLYAKAFITTMVSQKTDWGTAIDLLIASLTEMPVSAELKCPDFLNLRHGAKESCLYIMNNDEVPVFRSCNSYYKKKDSKTPCCRLCPLSNIYYNTNEEQEYEILKYIFSSKDNFDFAMQYFDAEFFKCGMDVAMELNVDKACVVPVVKEIVASALKSNLRFVLFDNNEVNYFGGNSSAFDIAWEDAISRFPRERRIPAKLKNNPMWANVLKQSIYDKMMASKDIGKADVRAIFDGYIQTSIQQVSEKKEKEPIWIDMQLADVVTSSAPSVIEATPVTEPLSSSDNVVSGEFTGVSSENAEDVTSDTPAAVVNELSEPEHSSDNNSTTETTGSETGPGTYEINAADFESQYMDKNDTTTSEPSNVPLSGEYQDTENRSAEKDSSVDENKELKPKPQPADNDTEVEIGAVVNESEIILTMNRDMTVHCQMDDASIQAYCEVITDSKLPETAYQGILRDKCISIEVVSDSNGAYAYLIWSRHTKKYYYVKASSDSGNVYDILSRNMIRKICHTPYLLYAVSRLYDHVVKNVFSIQTAHSRVTGRAAVMSYQSIMTLYDMEKEFGRNVSEEMKQACIFMAGLPYYKGIAHVLTHSLDYYEKPLLYIMDCNVDESIGYSYLYSRNFMDSGFLMQVLPDGRHLYREEFLRVAKQSGYFISYTVSNRDGAVHIFRYLLYCLSRDGHMRKCNLQLTGMQKEYITFYVSDDYFDYITTIINMYFFEYSSLYPSQNIRINQLTERCMKQKIKPQKTYYNGADANSE